MGCDVLDERDRTALKPGRSIPPSTRANGSGPRRRTRGRSARAASRCGGARQHLCQGHRDRPGHRRARRAAVGERLRRRPRHQVRHVARFPNTPVRLADGLHWDVLALWHSAMAGLGTASRDTGDLIGAGVDPGRSTTSSFAAPGCSATPSTTATTATSSAWPPCTRRSGQRSSTGATACSISPSTRSSSSRQRAASSMRRTGCCSSPTC